MSEIVTFSVIAGAGLAGYFAVSWIIEHSRRQQKDRAKETTDPEPEAAEAVQPSVRSREWFEILDVKPSASLVEIKSAYRRLIRKYHPDRVQGLGIELQLLAEVKAKEINAAYTQAMISHR
jgi:DnaJ-domain-containing protein 1